ncbi:MAG: PAS domain S-box protein [Gelidibacter sp.]
MKKKINPIKILFLADAQSPLILNTIKLQKKENAFEILLSDSESLYKEALKDYNPDIICFDTSLKAFSYNLALDILKKSKLQASFIVLSDNSCNEFGIMMLENGVNDYALKDTPENLLFFIEKIAFKFKLERERCELEEKSKDTEYRVKDFNAANSEIVCFLTEKGEIKFITSAIENLLGFSEKEANNRKLIDLLNLNSPEIFTEALNDTIIHPKKNAASILIHAKNRKGKSIWFQASFINQLDDATIMGIIVLLKEVINTKFSDFKSVGNEKKYCAFFESSLDGILLTTIDGKVHAANPAACKMFQMTEQEICEIGRSGLADLNESNFHKALKERESKGKSKSEINLFRKDGSSFIAELSSVRIDSSSGYFSLIIKDDTEKRHIKRKLEKSEERYKLLFKLNPLPTFMFNENDLTIVDVNDSCSKKYGYTRDEFLKMNLLDLRNIKEKKELYAILQEFRKSNKSSLHTFSRHQKKDKTEISVEINSHRFFIDGIPYIVSVCDDITEKDKILKKLIDTSEKLKVAEKIAKIGYWEIDLKDDSLFGSDYFFKIYGVKDRHIRPDPKGFKNKVHPMDRTKFNEYLKKLLLGTNVRELKYRIVLDDGSIKWLHSRSKLVKNPNGQAICMKGVVQDITSEKRTFENLAKSESRYKGLIQSQTNYFVRIGVDGNYSFCNKKFIEEFGWAFPDNNPIGMSSLTDVKKYHHQKLFDTTKESMAHPNVITQMEIDKRMKNGGTKTTLWEVIYLTDAEDVGEIQCVGIDISERVKIDRENQFQANLLEKIGQGIMATDADDHVTYWNNAAKEMYQWTKEEVLGKNIFLLLYGDYDNHKETIPLLKTGKSWTGEIIAKRKDGSTLPIQITKSPLFDQNDSLSGVISISSDISSLRKSEIKLTKLNNDLKDYTKELFSANEGLDQFSYIVSHNLRAPIANIIGIGDLLESNSEPEDIHKQLLYELFSNIGRLDDIMQDLNEALKIKTEFPKKLEYVKLEELIHDILDANQKLMVEENVIITTDFREIDEIYTIKNYLYNTFFNLISNSIKYRKPELSPVIEIRTKSVENQIIIYFKDNGLGIDLEKKGDDIFRLYKRFHHHIEGKGLGLFMVKTQLEMLGGRITVISSVGDGTEFIIHLKNNK